MKLIIYLIILISISINIVNSAKVQCVDSFDNNKISLADGYCTWKYNNGFNFTHARQLYRLPDNNILLMGGGGVDLLVDGNKDGLISSNERKRLIVQSDLTHSVTYNNGYIYASSKVNIYRWPYSLDGEPVSESAQIVIGGLPSTGHITRTVIFDSNGTLYFSIGSAGNIDSDSSRARVYNCEGLDLDNIPPQGYVATHCNPWFDGLRNEVGLRFDSNGKMWGVENGIDELKRMDWTPSDIHENNPCEELNYLERPGFYGYPYCFSEGILDTAFKQGPGYQWATNPNDTNHNDAYCADLDNVIRPAYCMPAHVAPLDLIFSNGVFPEPYNNGIFVAQHGSFARKVPSGYQIAFIELNSTTNLPVANSMKKFIGLPENGVKWSIRPVSLAFKSPCTDEIPECLLFSSDSDNSVYAIALNGVGTISPTESSQSTDLSIINNMKYLILLIILSCFNYLIVESQIQCSSNFNDQDIFLADGFCAWQYTKDITFSNARQIMTLSNNEVLLMSGDGISLLFDSNNNGIIESNEKMLLISQSGLTHSVTYYNGYIYASSPSTIYRWPYTVGSHTAVSVSSQIVIGGLPSTGHRTRTVIFDGNGTLYFSIGSNDNIDPDSSRSRVYNCEDIDLDNIPPQGYVVTHCHPWFDGLRNEVGLRFDHLGRLWGVENGMDNLKRNDWTPSDIHNDNPCEEVNLFERQGFYGYPYCFSEGILTSPNKQGPGYQWAVNITDTVHTDAYCADLDNVVRPVYCMPAHSAPLDLLFFNSTTFPTSFRQGLFVSQHGSWNRQVPAGYQIVYIQMNYTNNLPVPNSMTKLIGYKTDGVKWSIRPVSLTIKSPCTNEIPECLLFSSDSDKTVYAIARSGSGTLPPTPTPSPSTTTSAPSSSSTITITILFYLFTSILLIFI
ncbi:hypothetical protein DLAC_10529 [Tieghemostelium lacteum]|uniref:Pyrroloquinoline quinone-dependent pyranose dehydrogenase beta-propeller domain-containing protein n=1 Tax=Tieghemostelium lacteum TaxID=361077 RepID=A0A151Z4S6_TIELA|nr:hypothetical protein DLAC_10529 [Tieghemostelium lacteum]|eukprot:KYQ88945.1 hypothetical protein DLAC_10529 [Tieghemostelium lacteum]